MLLTVTGSNLLDIKAMDSLRNELAQHVRQASGKPDTALRELAEIWNEAADRGEFLFRDSRSQSGRRHPRPKVIPSYAETRVLPAIDSLKSIAPPDVDPGAWREAIDETCAMLLSATDASSFDVARLRKLRERLLQRSIGHARPSSSPGRTGRDLGPGRHVCQGPTSSTQDPAIAARGDRSRSDR